MYDAINGWHIVAGLQLYDDIDYWKPENEAFIILTIFNGDLQPIRTFDTGISTNPIGGAGRIMSLELQIENNG